MGVCALEEEFYPVRRKVAKISLNCLYLLNKFGCERYFVGNPRMSGEGGFTKPSKDVSKTSFYSYIEVGFSKMLETCCHELAHYIQFVKWGRSSCESDLVLRRGNYSAELAKEHKDWTREIYGMIKKEYSEWEKRWGEI